MGIQVLGADGSSLQKIDPTGAGRFNPRPVDVGALGAYSLGLSSGIMAAGLAANANIASLRYGGSGVALVKQVLFGMGGLATAFTAGQAIFNLFVARGFSASDTGGAAATLTTNNGKLKTSQASTGIVDFRVSTTAALGAGTRVVDATPVATLSVGIGIVVSTIYVLPGTKLWQVASGDWPIALANNEGLLIQATVPATGTWCFSTGFVIEEVAAYP